MVYQNSEIPACLMVELMMPETYQCEIIEMNIRYFFQGCLPKLATNVPVGGLILNDRQLA